MAELQEHLHAASSTGVNISWASGSSCVRVVVVESFLK